jgi:hypothetical protein
VTLRSHVFAGLALLGCQLEQKGPLVSLTWSQLDAAIEYHGDGGGAETPVDPLDPDGDGIRGAMDLCPDQPEDLDGYRDLDGCPDTDNDLDGLPDAVDRCPDEAEWLAASEKPDGCPKPSNRCVPADPPKEVCNYKDDDCDGFVDEDFSIALECGGGGRGVCVYTGYLVCSPEGNGVTCVGAAPGPRVEVCNGVDDDCDGVIDNDCVE